MSLVFRRWHEVAVKLLWRSILLHYRPHQVPQKHLCRIRRGPSCISSKGPKALNWGPCWLNSLIWETVHPQNIRAVSLFHYRFLQIFFYLSNTWQSILDHATFNSTTAKLSYLSVRRLNVVQASSFQIMSHERFQRIQNSSTGSNGCAKKPSSRCASARPSGAIGTSLDSALSVSEGHWTLSLLPLVLDVASASSCDYALQQVQCCLVSLWVQKQI